MEANLFTGCSIRGVRGEVSLALGDPRRIVLLLRHGWWAMAGYAQDGLRVVKRDGFDGRRGNATAGESVAFRPLPSRGGLSNSAGGRQLGGHDVVSLNDFGAGDWRSHGWMGRRPAGLTVWTGTGDDGERYRQARAPVLHALRCC